MDYNKERKIDRHSLPPSLSPSRNTAHLPIKEVVQGGACAWYYPALLGGVVPL